MDDVAAALKFVKGAVSIKGLVPEMSHVAIEDGLVRAYNGVITLASPIDFSVNCNPRALEFIKAIDSCEDDRVALNMTDTGRLRVQSGKFKAFINCIEGEVQHLWPVGEVIEIDGEAIMKAVKILEPFIANDAVRQWANGILFQGQSAFATNNVCLVEYWVGSIFPTVANIPVAAVKELLRIKTPPTHAQLCEHSITFHFPDGRWLRTQLYETSWPDLSKLLALPSEQVSVPTGLFAGLETIKPFADKNELVYFKDGMLYTHQDTQLGASYEVPDLHSEGCFKISMLQLLYGVAKTADFSTYPGPVMFTGTNLRGAIMGLRT